MKKGNQKDFCIPVCLLAAFFLWTVLIQSVDVQRIGPLGSCVGFAAVNQAFHNFTGVHTVLYRITDWLGLVPFAFAFGFALLGLTQWIRRKHLLKVDYSILILGGFYLTVMAVYLLFEVFVINYRPVLIGGALEASYPSSTTMLVLCVMPTALMQCNARIKQKLIRRYVSAAITGFVVFMVIGRLLSGVHWLTDIIGGALLSAGLVCLYRAVIRLKN